MKTKLLILFICSLPILSGNSNLSAQITIGSGIPPERGALLDHKETDTTNPTQDVASLENATKGVLYPKVFLRDAAKLTPLYGGTDDGSGVWSDNATADEKLKATGMTVYNVNTNAINMDEGLYMWQIDEWVKLNREGTAVIKPVDCSTIRINGSYIEGTPVNNNNYLEIDLDVTKKGSFVISALSGNGYSFYYAGVALATGIITVKVPAQGTPVMEGQNTLTFSGIKLTCPLEITVQDKVAEYTMLCSSVVVHGTYFKNRGLVGGSHYISMNINVSQPGSYNIYTETKNGISFKSSGSFGSAGSQTVTLQGAGTPTTNEDFQVIIKANTALGSEECSAIIPITLPEMTFAVIGQAGSGSWYSWNGDARNRALTNGASFGPGGIVRMEKPLRKLWSTDDAPQAITWLDNGNGGKWPDIVLYTGYSGPSTLNLSAALARYVKKGGCIIYYTDDSSPVRTNIVINGIFGTGYSARAMGAGTPDYPDQLYQINNYSSDPIISGPFGSVMGYYWGEDNVTANTMVLDQLPPNSVQVCPAFNTVGHTSNPPTSSVVWYSKSENFFFFGDTVGAAAAGTGDGNNSTGWPCLYNGTTGIPMPKRYGYERPADYQWTYNSVLEMNAIAYFIRQAAVSGINPY